MVQPVLAEVAQRAREQGVSADALMIAEGFITESAFYQKLADHLGASVARGDEPLAADLDWRNALASGMAQLADGGFLLAPRAQAIAVLLQNVSPHAQGKHLVIAPPTRFGSMVRAACAGEMAAAAADELAQKHPDLSARSGIHARQKYALGGVGALIALGLVDGGAVWMMACALFGLAMLVGVVLRLACTLLGTLSFLSASRVLTDAQLPTYSVLVALYREAAIVPQLVAALRALDYPAAKCEIVFLVEVDDEETQAALAVQDMPPNFTIITVPEGFPRTKPRALNFGLLAACGECLVIFDAEDKPEPDQLRKAAARFADGSARLACLQAALCIENYRDSWLTRLFALDYAAQFDVFLRGLAVLGLPAPLGGTSNHFRTRILREIGGWDAWNVTEDADLGLRLARAGYHTGALESVTWEEAPPTLRDWLPQRRRWMKGWMQTFVTHTRRPIKLWRDLGLAHGVHVLALLASNTLGPLVGVWCTVFVLYAGIAGDLLAAQDSLLHEIANACWLGLASLGLLSIVLPTLVAMQRRKLWSCAIFLVLRPLHWLLMSAACLAALVELNRNPFHWAKTRHGLAHGGLSTDRDPDPP